MDNKRNRALCIGCMTVLESKHRHDFQACECDNFIDGGHDYIRIGGPSFTDLILLNDDEIPNFPPVKGNKNTLPKSLGAAIKRHIQPKVAPRAKAVCETKEVRLEYY